MKSVTNKTNAPLKVPLPRNKWLRLGPGRSGQVSDEGAGRPALVKMAEAGMIEVSEADSTMGKGGGRGGAFGKGGRSALGRNVGRRGGDR